MHISLRSLAAAASLALLAGCGNSAGAPSSTPSTFGYAVADEPQAALVARQILNEGGNAADAAAAAGLAQAVTLPSRGGLGGGGACLIKMFNSKGEAQPPVALLFPAAAPDGNAGDRPAAVPTLARGLLAMQARYGVLPSSAVIIPAERLAANAEVSPALEKDLQTVGPALLADPAAAAIFAPNGTLLPANATLVQPDLATTLEILRTQGVLGMSSGSFAQGFVTAADAAGGGLTMADLANGAPRYASPVFSKDGKYAVASLPTATSPFEALPASAAFMTLDKNGGSVICVTSMNNLFGTGRIAPGTGKLLAASPQSNPTPDLAAVMAYASGNLAFRAAASGTGQAAAIQAAKIGLANALNKTQTPIPSPGQADIISCPGNVPGGEASCTASAGQKDTGLAIGGR